MEKGWLKKDKKGSLKKNGIKLDRYIIKIQKHIVMMRLLISCKSV